MEDQSRDQELARRVRDIVAVVADDIDAVTFDVEDGVVYIEGVVPTDQQRNAISSAVKQLDGASHVITCLSTERVMPQEEAPAPLYPPPVFMHYHSLS